MNWIIDWRLPEVVSYGLGFAWTLEAHRLIASLTVRSLRAYHSARFSPISPPSRRSHHSLTVRSQPASRILCSRHWWVYSLSVSQIPFSPHFTIFSLTQVTKSKSICYDFGHLAMPISIFGLTVRFSLTKETLG